jgi:hypothetical protein
MKTGPQMTMKNIWGHGASISAPFLYLACFAEGPGVGKAIAECMERIEDSIRAKSEICDLSCFGDLQAWSKDSEQIQWPSDNRAA